MSTPAHLTPEWVTAGRSRLSPCRSEPGNTRLSSGIWQRRHGRREVNRWIPPRGVGNGAVLPPVRINAVLAFSRRRAENCGVELGHLIVLNGIIQVSVAENPYPSPVRPLRIRVTSGRSNDRHLVRNYVVPADGCVGDIP